MIAYFDFVDEGRYVDKVLKNTEEGSPKNVQEKHVANVLGRFVLYSSLFIIPIMSGWNVFKRYRNGKMEGESLTKSLFQPTDKWVPNKDLLESDNNLTQDCA